jgi:hypothetical protein
MVSALPNGYKHDVVYNPQNKKGTKMPDPYRFFKLQCCSKNLNAHRKIIGTCREVVEYGNPQVVKMNWNKKPEPEEEFEGCSCDTSYYEDPKSRSTTYSCSSKSRATKKNLGSCDCSTSYDYNSINLLNENSTKTETRAKSKARSKLTQKNSKKHKHAVKKAHPQTIEFVVGHPPPQKSSSHPCPKWNNSPHCILKNNTKSLNNNADGKMDVNYHKQFNSLHKTKGGRNNSLKRLSKKYHSISDLERRLHKNKFHAKHHSNGHLPHPKAEHLSTKTKRDRTRHSPKDSRRNSREGSEGLEKPSEEYRRNSREGSEGLENLSEEYRNMVTLEDIEKGDPKYFETYENPEDEEKQNHKNDTNKELTDQIHPDQDDDGFQRNSRTGSNDLSSSHGSAPVMKNKKKAKQDNLALDSNFWGFQSTRHIDLKPEVKVPRMYSRDIASNPRAKQALLDEMDESVTVIPQIMSTHTHTIPDPYNTVAIPRLRDIETKIKAGTILEAKDSDMTKLSIKATPYTKEPPHGLRVLKIALTQNNEIIFIPIYD